MPIQDSCLSMNIINGSWLFSLFLFVVIEVKVVVAQEVLVIPSGAALLDGISYWQMANGTGVMANASLSEGSVNFTISDTIYQGNATFMLQTILVSVDKLGKGTISFKSVDNASLWHILWENSDIPSMTLTGWSPPDAQRQYPSQLHHNSTSVWVNRDNKTLVLQISNGIANAVSFPITSPGDLLIFSGIATNQNGWTWTLSGSINVSTNAMALLTYMGGNGSLTWIYPSGIPQWYFYGMPQYVDLSVHDANTSNGNDIANNSTGARHESNVTGGIVSGAELLNGISSWQMLNGSTAIAQADLFEGSFNVTIAGATFQGNATFITGMVNISVLAFGRTAVGSLFLSNIGNSSVWRIMWADPEFSLWTLTDWMRSGNESMHPSVLPSNCNSIWINNVSKTLVVKIDNGMVSATIFPTTSSDSFLFVGSASSQNFISWTFVGSLFSANMTTASAQMNYVNGSGTITWLYPLGLPQWSYYGVSPNVQIVTFGNNGSRPGGTTGYIPPLNNNSIDCSTNSSGCSSSSGGVRCLPNGTMCVGTAGTNSNVSTAGSFPPTVGILPPTVLFSSLAYGTSNWSDIYGVEYAISMNWMDGTCNITSTSMVASGYLITSLNSIMIVLQSSFGKSLKAQLSYGMTATWQSNWMLSWLLGINGQWSLKSTFPRPFPGFKVLTPQALINKYSLWSTSIDGETQLFYCDAHDITDQSRSGNAYSVQVPVLSPMHEGAGTYYIDDSGAMFVNMTVNGYSSFGIIRSNGTVTLATFNSQGSTSTYVLIDFFPSPSLIIRSITQECHTYQSPVLSTDPIAPVSFNDLAHGNSWWMTPDGSIERITLLLDSYKAIIYSRTSLAPISALIYIQSAAVTIEFMTLTGIIRGDLRLTSPAGSPFYNWIIQWDDANWGQWVLTSYASCTLLLPTMVSNVLQRSSVWESSPNKTHFIRVDPLTNTFFTVTLPQSSADINAKGNIITTQNDELILQVTQNNDMSTNLTATIVYYGNTVVIRWIVDRIILDEWTFLHCDETLANDFFRGSIYDRSTGKKILIAFDRSSGMISSRDEHGDPAFEAAGFVDWTDNPDAAPLVNMFFKQANEVRRGTIFEESILWENGESWWSIAAIYDKRIGSPCDHLDGWSNGTGGIEVVRGSLHLVLSLNNTLYIGNISENTVAVDWGHGCIWYAETFIIPRVFYDVRTLSKITVSVQNNSITAVEAKNYFFGYSTGMLSVNDTTGVKTVELHHDGTMRRGYVSDDDSMITWDDLSYWIAERYLLSPSWYIGNDTSTRASAPITCSTIDGIVYIQKSS